MYTLESQKSHECYNRGQYRYAEDGVTILNESGKPAKPGQVILRHPSTGYPLVRYGDKGPQNIDLKTGKVVA
ncbi:MAG: hypothetical protein M0Q16_06840 [Candidatus Cloacimonetes bacterium]|nr:hypothetical protein [Candidatus Cloacimonadota bacterium]